MQWTRSSKCQDIGCNAGECVEVAFDDEGNAYVRSSNRPADVLWFTPQEWQAFLGGIQDGEFRY